MSSTARTELGPDQRVSIQQAAVFIGASERSLRRTIQKLREGGEPSRTANGWQLQAAKAFVDHEVQRRDLTVSGLYRAIGEPAPIAAVTVARIGDPPRQPKQVRNRLDDITEDLSSAASAAEATAEERKSVREKLVALKNRRGRPSWAQIAAVVEWLREAGECPMEIFKGVSLAKLTKDNIPRFTTFADFLVQATPADRWIFVFSTAESRPVDLLRAEDDPTRYGFVVSLSLSEYVHLMAAAVDREQREDEAQKEVEAIRAAIASSASKATR
jgi:hypothetical protein